MKIIIAGAGAVGTHLAKLLSDEKQDIILMDENEEKLSKLDSNFDLMTVNASPTSISGLKNAGVAGADLFIGVMPEESRNMTACMLATNMGAKKTVARIDNYEYLLPKHKEFFSQLGVHSLIYPEMLAAKDIVDAIKMSWIRQWWEFCGGALVLIGTKMRETAEILKMHGEMPVATVAESLQASVIEELPSRVFSCCEAVAVVQADMEKVAKLAREIRDEAAEADDFLVQGTFEGYLAGFAKDLWFLRAMRSDAHAGEACDAKAEEKTAGAKRCCRKKA